MKKGRWLRLPLNDVLEPKVGRVCYPPSWWKVTEDGFVLFFDTYSSPQCNKVKEIAERLGKGFDAPKTLTVFLPMTFIPQVQE